MKDKEYIYGGYFRTCFSNDEYVNNNFLRDVGNVAIKAIMSELPVEIQTYEVISHILRIAEKELNNKRIVL